MELQDAVLNGPQGPQGGDLGLGQPIHPADIEPLVGPITSQRAQVVAALQIPEHDSSIIAATGQLAAIGTHLESMHRALMGFSHP